MIPTSASAPHSKPSGAPLHTIDLIRKKRDGGDVYKRQIQWAVSPLRFIDAPHLTFHVGVMMLNQAS